MQTWTFCWKEPLKPSGPFDAAPAQRRHWGQVIERVAADPRSSPPGIIGSFTRGKKLGLHQPPQYSLRGIDNIDFL